MGWEYKYPHIPLILSMRPTPRVLLGKYLYWTIKEDGECCALWIKDDSPNISSRNLDIALQDIQHRCRECEDFPKMLELLEEHPQFVIYFEECKEGRSVTGVKVYPRTMLVVFDIYDRSAEKFLPYVAVHQHCFHHKIPVVKLYAKTRHRSMKDLLKFKNHVLEHCHAIKEEGMVVKTYSKEFGYVQAKVKIDTPEPERKKIQRGEPIFPPIPDNEIFGAINKAHQELGDDKIRDVKLAMPMVAKFVKEECKKHLYSSPKGKLFNYWKEYLERMMNG
jgi:hypothetical protein